MLSIFRRRADQVPFLSWGRKVGIRASALVLALTLATPALAESQLAFSLGERFSRAGDETELFVRGRADARLPFGLSFLYGVSLTDEGSFWAGAGLGGQWHVADAWFVGASFMPGLRKRRGGPDFGHPVQFRTGLEAGRIFRGGGRMSFGVDHLSNGGLDDVNPGSNAVFLRYAIPTR